ncbi:MAG: hypothetical protein ACI8S6_004717 [Myxococcota bacterium]|jgi:hypothetical protein
MYWSHGDPVSVAVLEAASRARRSQRLSGLAARTHPAGAIFRRLARRLRPRRVGLALGGGGAWGFAHIALIARLEQDKIPIDLITGCCSRT